MRSLVLLMAFLSILPVAFVLPHLGVLGWAWVAVMQPHREVFGIAYGMQLNLYIAVITMLAWVISREPVRIPINSTTVLIILLMCWGTMAQLMSLDTAYSHQFWDRTMKTMVFALVVAGLINTKVRIQALIWVISICLGYYGFKGGIFTVATGGKFLVHGPDVSMINDRNHFALAMVLTLPILNYLRMHSENKWVRLAVIIVGVTSLMTVIGSHSRGGLIALVVVAGVFWLKSRHKVIMGVAIAILVIPMTMFMPDEWHERMGTIEHAEEDGSFQGRLDAWEAILNIAQDRPLFGAGFRTYEREEIFFRYNPVAEKARAAHSIYFEVLGDQGWPGLIIYLAIILTAIRNSRWIIRNTKKRPDLAWARDFASMTEVSLAGFLVAGAALSLAYYDVVFLLIVVLMTVRGLVRQAISETDKRRPMFPAFAGGQAPAAGPAPAPAQARAQHGMRHARR